MTTLSDCDDVTPLGSLDEFIVGEIESSIEQFLSCLRTDITFGRYFTSYFKDKKS